MNPCAMAFTSWLLGAALTGGGGSPLAVILIGSPGSGKSTQAERITRDRGIPAISTGELLRAEVRSGSDRAREIQAAMAAGQLVSDKIVNQILIERISAPDCGKGFILDGYPRTVEQARHLDQLLAQRGWPEPVILDIDIPDDVVVKRLMARGRADDTEEVIRRRLSIYHDSTAPILEYYRSRNYHKLNGDQTPDQVARDLAAALESRSVR